MFVVDNKMGVFCHPGRCCVCRCTLKFAKLGAALLAWSLMQSSRKHGLAEVLVEGLQPKGITRGTHQSVEL